MSCVVQQVGNRLCDELGATSVVVLNASGPDSGQSMAHLHFHVVPRRAGDVVLWPGEH